MSQRGMTTNRNTSAVWFFYRNAGYSYDPANETKQQGRWRGARTLANAEAWARQENITFGWEEDWLVGDHIREYGYDDNPLTCEVAAAYASDGEILASLGCIDDASNDYRRVINAELALEAQDRYPSLLLEKAGC